jgi:hypothetical protein
MLELRSQQFRSAVRDIQRRAERQLLDERLVRCFVPNRVLDELNSTSNQLLFGRRGVGKTHTLKVFASEQVLAGELTVYLDCTSFGSGLGADGSSKNVGIRFFRTFLRSLADSLFEHASRREPPVEGLDNQIITALSNIESASEAKSDGATFDYLGIQRFVNEFLHLIGARRVTILLDEWAQVPRNAQPFLAEFIKRAFFANACVTMKIGVVDFTYRLDGEYEGSRIGLERAADVFSDIQMDRYFVWDQDEKFVQRFFAEVIYNHLAVELELDLQITTEAKYQFVLNSLFTQERVLIEMCRAAEGNARDLLVLFAKAHARFCQQTAHQRIGLDDVHFASTELYRGDKYSNISTERYLEEFLEHLIDTVIKEKKSRTFMVPFHLRNHPLLQRLYSARILHLLDVEWSHPDRPGERYSLVTMDYGTYVSFRGTRNEPHQQLFWAPEPTDADLVPLDDRRSIRRIIVPESTLERFWIRKDEPADEASTDDEPSIW